MAPASLVVSLGLAAVFGAAGIAKLRDRRRFDGIVLDYRLMPPRLALRLASALPWMEIALAAGLALGAPPALPAAAVLLAAYGAAIGVNLGRGRHEIDCGCGGAPQPISPWQVIRNLLLAAAALLAWALGRGG